MTVSQLAKELGLGYHSVQKVVKGIFNTPAIRKLIAEHFGVRYYQMWGDESSRTLRRLMTEEIDRHAKEERARLRALFLS